MIRTASKDTKPAAKAEVKTVDFTPSSDWPATLAFHDDRLVFSSSAKFDRNAYQREYMRKRRAAAKAKP